MALETGSFISDLVITNPDGGDLRVFADDHLRLLKKTIKQSFSGITGAVNISQTNFNYLDGLTGNIQTQLDGKFNRADVSYSVLVAVPNSTFIPTVVTVDPNGQTRFSVCVSAHDTTIEAVNRFGSASTSALNYYVRIDKDSPGSTVEANVVIYNWYAATKTLSVVIRTWA